MKIKESLKFKRNKMINEIAQEMKKLKETGKEPKFIISDWLGNTIKEIK